MAGSLSGAISTCVDVLHVIYDEGKYDSGADPDGWGG